MPFFRQRSECFRQHLKFRNLKCRFAGLGEKTFSFDTDEIAKIQQLEKIDSLGASGFGMNVNLDAAGGVAKIDKVAFPHVAMRRDAPGRPQRFAFLEFFAHLRHRTARLESYPTKWIDAFPSQRVKLFAAQRDQFIFFVHLWRANVKRCAGFATRNR